MRMWVFGVAIVFSAAAMASSTDQSRMDLLKKLDMLDALEFEELISEANQCTRQRNFKCANAKLAEAEKLKQSDGHRESISNARWMMDSEIKHVQREKAQAEQRRIAKAEAERREREERERRERAEQDSGINFGQVMALAGGAYLANSSGLSSSQQTEFLTSYSQDVMSNSTSNMQRYQQNNGDSRSVDEIMRDNQREINAAYQKKIAEQQADPNRKMTTIEYGRLQYEQGVARSQAYEQAQRNPKNQSARRASNLIAQTVPTTAAQQARQRKEEARRQVDAAAKAKTEEQARAKAAADKYVCKAFKLTGGVERKINVNGKMVPITTKISPSPVGKYYMANKPKGESDTYLEIKAGGNAERVGFIPGRYKWGIALRDDGKLECPGEKLIIATEHDDGSVDHFTGYIHPKTGAFCIGSGYHCR